MLDQIKPDILVLAVDDEPFNLDLIDLAFAEEPQVEVLRAENGDAALRILETREPDIILLDLAMPVLNGFDTLEILKRHERLYAIPVIVVTANGEEKNRALVMGANDFLAKPVDVVELRLRTRNYARLKGYHDQLVDMNARLSERVDERTQELREALELAREAEREIAYRLGRAADTRDTETGAHIRRMSRYSARLAELAGLPDDEVRLILNAAPLHDIGKVGIPDAILLKPGRLTGDEFEIMKRHAAIGGGMLEGCERFPLIEAGRIIAMQHHEWFDGSGYPEGLAGEEIHIFGRIVAVADVFDALISPRVYKKALPLGKVLRIMTEERGTHFDPRFVDLLLEHLDDFLEIRYRYPDDEAAAADLADLVVVEV